MAAYQSQIFEFNEVMSPALSVIAIANPEMFIYEVLIQTNSNSIKLFTIFR